MSRAGMGAGVVAKASLVGKRPTPDRMGKEWVDALARVPLFEHLSKRHLRQIAELATIRRFEAGSLIIRVGDRGDAFYVILDGLARVRPRKGSTSTLSTGDFFGEMALLDGAPRSATVDATTEVLTMRIGRTAFWKVVNQEPRIASTLLATMAQRVRGVESSAAG